MTNPETNMLPEAYRGLTLDQSVAKAFFNRTSEAMDAGVPAEELLSYTTRFNTGGTTRVKRLVLQELTTALISQR